MKYFVTVNGTEHELSLDGNSVHIEGQDVVAHVSDVEGTPIRMVHIGDAMHRIVVRAGARRGEYTLWVAGHRYAVEALDERARTIRELSGIGAAPAGPAPLIAPMPGLIVRVNVAPGDQVQAGQGLVVMEAMKMENELRALTAGTIKAVRVTPGTVVEKGTVLLEIE